MPKMQECDLLASGLHVVHLKISECVVTRKTCVVSTVLGSCVSVTFHHPGTRLSAMFHAMLPASRNAEAEAAPGKFVDSAIRRIMAQFDGAGVPYNEIQIKLFGGAYAVLNSGDERVRDLVDVGAKNVAMAREHLARLRLTVQREDVLGSVSRKVLFHTGTGEVWLQYLRGLVAENGPSGGRSGSRRG